MDLSYVKLVVSACLIFVLLSCSSFKQSENNTVIWDRETESYAVYAKVIEVDYPFDGYCVKRSYPWAVPESGPYPSLVTIQAEHLKPAGDFIFAEKYYMEQKKLFSKLQRETSIDFFKQANQPPKPFERRFPLAIDYKIVTKEDAPFNGPEWWWDDFYRKYPGSGGLITFSNIGFNKDGTQAFLWVEIHREGLCSIGYTVYLEKKNEHWKYLKKNIFMVS